MSGRRGASKSRAPQRRNAPKAPPRGKTTRRKSQRRSPRQRRRTLLLLGIALAAAAALLWGVVRVGNPGRPQFRLAPTAAAGPTQAIEIEESERQELRSLIDQLGKDAKH